jgi:G:T-mismatch repair DNA endonuclease (very short patch repair protein)
MGKIGFHFSRESKDKMRKSRLRYLETHSQWNKGRKETRPEVLVKLKNSHRGLHHTFHVSKELWKEHIRQCKHEYYKTHASCNAGKHLSLETRQKMRMARIGFHHSEETRRKIGLAGKGNKNRKGKKGYHHSKEAKEKMARSISLARRGKKLSEECKMKISLAMANRVLSEEHKQKIRKWRATYIVPVMDTKPEKIVQDMLKELKVSFKTHVPLCLDGKFHQVDIMFDKSPEIIEVEGCFWHQCMLCGFNQGHNGLTAIEVREHDKMRDNSLGAKGFCVHRIWEHETLDMEQLTDRLQSIVNGNV